jgi:hypothetical protein
VTRAQSERGTGLTPFSPEIDNVVSLRNRRNF